ncbi:hypothetical protein OK016_00080 [Vibrio chagasii]|nr:hypothetical protein [Vibrio chagasii]
MMTCDVTTVSFVSGCVSHRRREHHLHGDTDEILRMARCGLVTLSNGATITIADGATSGTTTVPASDDVYVGGDTASATITDATGGN